MEIEHVTEVRLRREEAARRLHLLADELTRQNELSFMRNGKRFTVKVPDEVAYTLEIEIGSDESEIEVELKW